jgi:hypothetical protein
MLQQRGQQQPRERMTEKFGAMVRTLIADGRCESREGAMLKGMAGRSFIPDSTVIIHH